MNELYLADRKKQAEFEDKVVKKLQTGKLFSNSEVLLAKENLKRLWKLFVDSDMQLLTYYSLRKDMEPKEVLDIFKRINSTGMVLTNSEILFSELKNTQFDFEEQIWDADLLMEKQTGGLSIGPDDILQTLHLLVKDSTRVDPERIKESDLKDFISVWAGLESPLKSFLYDFLYREFKITHEKILAHKRVLIPLIAYFYYLRTGGNKFQNISATSLSKMKKYLIYSQLLDWDLQTYVDNFSKIIKAKFKNNKNPDFPFTDILNFVQNSGRRRTDLISEDLNSAHRWFVLKILTPTTAFTFLKDPNGERFSPEVDHIFPPFPGYPVPYPTAFYDLGDSVWNLQPVKGTINNLKLDSQPKDFFVKYPQYLKDYDFLPTTNLNDQKWLPQFADQFVLTRKDKIVAWMNSNYGLQIT